MADTDFTLIGHTTRYGETKEVKVKLTDNGDGTHSLAADPTMMHELTQTNAKLDAVLTILGNLGFTGGGLQVKLI